MRVRWEHLEPTVRDVAAVQVGRQRLGGSVADHGRVHRGGEEQQCTDEMRTGGERHQNTSKV
jgi:hypothetical protein